MSAESIEASLELVAERIGDPAGRIYERLFAAAPDLRELFVLDTDATVRGEMLYKAIEMIQDLAGDAVYARELIAIEYVNHRGLGVPPARFMLFFDAMIDTFRDAIGAQWSPEIDAAWRDIRGQVAAVLDRADEAH